MQSCVELFLEKGYKKTTMAQIVAKSSVSNSSLQNIFHSKDGVLAELAEFMFTNQFEAARKAVGDLPRYAYTPWKRRFSLP